MTEEQALDLRDRFVRPDTEEERAWCLLLNSVVRAGRASWNWAHRELTRAARPSLADPSKYWVAMSALHGIESSEQDFALPADDWQGLFRLVLPIPVTSVDLWERVHETLRLLAEKGSPRMRELVRIIAAHSAPTWLQILKDQKFAWFFQTLTAKGLGQAVSTDLCFSSGTHFRHLGLVIFDKCALHEFDTDAVLSATSEKVELLLLDAQRRELGYGTLARLHACLAARADELGANLRELLYEEVALQCMNTSEYRVTLASACPSHEYLQAILADVEERLGAIASASRSPAFRMQVPGHHRAEVLQVRRLVREVSSNVKQKSSFLNLFSSVHMLYGGMEPRIFLKEGMLSPPVQIKASSSSVELPRLEFLDPEGMTIHRLTAATRVAVLEPKIADSAESH